MTPISCNVISIEPLTDVVNKITLSPQTPVEYAAGQYLQVVMGEGDLRPFSIANAPQENHYLELHIGAEPGNSYAGEVLERMREKGVIDIDGGHGQAQFQSSNIKPMILLAGGTGFSYTYAILQQRLLMDDNQAVHLYWGTRTLADMYAYEALQALDTLHEHFTFHPVIDQCEDSWTGKKGFVHLAVMNDFDSLVNYQVYVAGRFEMAAVVREDFKSKGLLSENLFGDAYQFI